MSHLYNFSVDHKKDVSHKSNPSTSSSTSSQYPLPSLSSSASSTCSSLAVLRRNSSSLRRTFDGHVLLPPSPTTDTEAQASQHATQRKEPQSPLFFPPRRVSFNGHVDVISPLAEIRENINHHPKHNGHASDAEIYPFKAAKKSTASPLHETCSALTAPPIRERLWDDSQLAMELADDNSDYAHNPWYKRISPSTHGWRLHWRKTPVPSPTSTCCSYATGTHPCECHVLSCKTKWSLKKLLTTLM